MDTFDLRWPQTTATFCTNGWRCRIVWRGKKGGLGGTIENNDQCKRRVADSLEGAPGLLDELREAGYMDLAREIQTLAPLPSADDAPMPMPGELIDNWVNALTDQSAWEACGNRRASSWLEVAEVNVSSGEATWCEAILLKAPAAKGKQEWILKCVCAAAPKGHVRATARYHTADSFYGVCACLASLEECRSLDFVDAFINSVVELVDGHAEVGKAADAWAAQKMLGDDTLGDNGHLVH